MQRAIRVSRAQRSTKRDSAECCAAPGKRRVALRRVRGTEALALSDQKLAKRLDAWRARQTKSVAQAAQKLKLNNIDRPVFDLAADMGVKTRIAAGEDLQGGQHRVGRFKNRHHRNRARRAQ